MKAPARSVATFARSGASRSQGRAFATRGTRNGSKGSGAPSTGRVGRILAILALAVAAFAIAAAPASAAPPTVEMGEITEVSYASAHVTGKLSSDGSGFFAATTYIFQYSTDENKWVDAFAETLYGGAINDKFVKADLSGLKGSTKYFVRLVAQNGPFIPDPANPETTSPKPNPSFTTLAVDPPTIPGAVAASPVFSTSATGTAKVKRPTNADPAFDVKCRFEYVTDAQFTSTGFDGATVRACQQNPIGKDDANVEKEVTAPLGCTSPVTEAAEGKCLSPNTTYHLRLVAENASPTAVTKAAAGTFTTLPPVAKPTVLATDDATDVSKRTARASGEIERPAGADPALDVDCRFEYVTDAQFTATGFDDAGQAACGQNPVGAAGPTAVTANLGGLNPGTVYHLRLAAENGGGTATKEAAGTFETIALIPPTLTLDPVTDVGYTEARFTGTVSSGNQDIFWTQQWAIDPDTEGWIGNSNGEGRLGPNAGDPPMPVSGTVPLRRAGLNHPPLKPGTTYKVRLEGFIPEEYGAGNGQVTVYSSVQEFTTLGTNTPPSATFDPVAPITATTAHFTATVDTHAPAGPLSEEGKDAYRTDWHFECTPECPPNADLSGVIEAEEGSKSISVDAIRLEPNTSYEVKLIAHNGADTVEVIKTFKTPLVPPTVKSAPGGSDGNGGYILEGIVNPNNSLVTDCKFEWGPNLPYAFSAPCSPTPGDKAKGVTVEAHLTGLTPEAVYHAKLVATNGGGSADSGDFTFIPTLDPKENCANEQQRKENSSLALPECRAYEQVSDPSKEGGDAFFGNLFGEDTVQYFAHANNIANSGAGTIGKSSYTTIRSSTGWETIANLNGPTGSQYTGEVAPEGEMYEPNFSADLRSSLWRGVPKDSKASDAGDFEVVLFLRKPDGSFVRVGEAPSGYACCGRMASDDLSHIVADSFWWGPGVYEFVGTGNGLPDRVDIDNAGNPVTSCSAPEGANSNANALSADGRVMVFTTLGGCGGANPPSNQVWARVGGTASVLVNASQCTRTSGDPGGACNSPVSGPECSGFVGASRVIYENGPDCRGARFEDAARDGSRVFFTANQQLLNGDIDQTSDLYACDIPSGTLTPTGTANSCSTLRQVSAGYPAGADVQRVLGSSEDGSSVYFVARGVLADNEDAFGDKAKFGDHNLYVWRSDAAHPGGQTTFATRLDTPEGTRVAQITPDGRYAVLSGTDRFTLTDNDDSNDFYRYDAETGEIARVSTNVSGTGGNGTFDAGSGGISDDGQKIIFNTVEGLSPVDGNEERDAYLWSASTGRVYLISSGSVGGGTSGGSISPSGKNVYFNTLQVLSPSDIDNTVDVYTARIGGGFTFTQKPSCEGEGCQPLAPAPPAVPAPAAPNPQGNVKSKSCPKGKVAKGEKCVKKAKKRKHAKKKAKGQSERASHDRGGSK